MQVWLLTALFSSFSGTDEPLNTEFHTLAALGGPRCQPG